ncbi:uncharacterized protein MONOS_17038 [Monocercomonoides exilis]|uniref:uncharacterized protein n=1 Tax=Monocercomonoides exilis TaxID=2049356 RepID=UPI0035599A25|nr:hypothetical protein MONOS_17038 [Monocercomonoides exilis]
MWQESILENKKASLVVIPNPLEMGKYFKTKKMIGFEQEYRKEREAIFTFLKRARTKVEIGTLPKREEEKGG